MLLGFTHEEETIMTTNAMRNGPAKALLFGSFALGATVAGTVAADANSTPSGELEEVMVTAQKRSESLQDVPVSIAAFSSNDIQAFRFRDPAEIAEQTPNLHTNGVIGAGTPVFSLRGISTFDYSLNHNSPVAVYIDEVYKGTHALLAVPFFDLERVEVLRGPQGTLYGRNSTGGAINFISKKPGFEQDGFLSMGVGNYNLTEAEGAINLPVSDTLAVRVSGTWAKADGWYKNVLPGVKDAFAIDDRAIRVGVLWAPSENFDATIRLTTAKSNPVHGGTKYADNNLPPGTFFGTYSFYNSLGATTLTDPNQNGLGFWEYNSQQDKRRLIETDSASLTMNWLLGGNYTVTSITSYDEGEVLNPDETDAAEPVLYDAEFRAKTQQFSQDLRLTSDLEGPFNFVAGVYYFQEKVNGSNQYGTALDLDLNIDGVVDSLDCTDPLAIAYGGAPSPGGAATETLFQSFGFSLGAYATYGCRIAASFEQEKTSLAGYFDGNYSLSDDVTVRFGVRYTRDEAKLSKVNSHQALADFTPLFGYINGGSLDPLATDPAGDQKNTDNEATGRVGIDYKFDSGNMVYASYSKGYRGGSYNGNAWYDVSEANWAKPEYIDAYEVGFKSVLWNERVRLNASAFHYEYEDQQIIEADGLTFLQNLINFGSSEITGGEIEATIQATPTLKIQVGAGYADTKIKDGIFNGFDVSGQDLPYTPDTNINASVKWDMLSFDAGDLTLWLDSSYRSDANTLVGGEAVTIDGYTLFNGRLSFNAENWSVSVWGRNLTEEKYYTAFFDLDYFGVAYGNPGAPLTFGAEFSYYW